MPEDDNLRDQIRIELTVDNLVSQVSRIEQVVLRLSENMTKILGKLEDVTHLTNQNERMDAEIREIQKAVAIINERQVNNVDHKSLATTIAKIFASLLGWGIAIWAVLK